MATKSCPTLKSCYDKDGEVQPDDRISELPEEILLLIISLLTNKDIARFSLVSRRCQVISRYVPFLIFQDHRAMENISNVLFLIFEDHRAWEKTWNNLNAVDEVRAAFVKRVDRVLEKHLGTTVDELRITFDLDQSWQDYVDEWAAFAVDKQVKRLELDFSSIWRRIRFRHRNGLTSHVYCGEPLDLPPKFTAGFKSFLTSLCLRYVNVTDEFVDYLSHSSPLLEMLCIQGSRCLTRVTGSLQVKQLEISHCRNLNIIDVSARKLNFLILHSAVPIQVHIMDAPSLLKMSVAGKGALFHAFDNLSDILSRLVYLNLRITPPRMGELMNGVAMPKLEHLELQLLYAKANSRLYGCISVITASPNLQKLTLKLEKFYGEPERDREVRVWSHRNFPQRLKTLELIGYRGKPVDLELALFVLENACMLEEIIVDFVSPLNDNDKRERFVMLREYLPRGVKLTVK